MVHLSERLKLVNNGQKIALEKVKGDIAIYKADGDLAMSGNRDQECFECGENIFNSIFSIIDKRLKEVEECH